MRRRRHGGSCPRTATAHGGARERWRQREQTELAQSLAVLRIRWALGCGAIGAVQYWREQLYVDRPRRLWRAVA